MLYYSQVVPVPLQDDILNFDLGEHHSRGKNRENYEKRYVKQVVPVASSIKCGYAKWKRKWGKYNFNFGIPGF